MSKREGAIQPCEIQLCTLYLFPITIIWQGVTTQEIPCSSESDDLQWGFARLFYCDLLRFALQKTVEPANVQGFQRLKWPLKESENDKYIAKIERYKGHSGLVKPSINPQEDHYLRRSAAADEIFVNLQIETIGNAQEPRAGN